MYHTDHSDYTHPKTLCPQYPQQTSPISSIIIYRTHTYPLTHIESVKLSPLQETPHFQASHTTPSFPRSCIVAVKTSMIFRSLIFCLPFNFLCFLHEGSYLSKGHETLRGRGCAVEGLHSRGADKLAVQGVFSGSDNACNILRCLRDVDNVKVLIYISVVFHFHSYI